MKLSTLNPKLGGDKFSWDVFPRAGNSSYKATPQRPPYLWAAGIIETLLQKSIDLWEDRNQDLHGHTLIRTSFGRDKFVMWSR